MKIDSITVPFFLTCLLFSSACNDTGSRHMQQVNNKIVVVNPQKMKQIGTVDERYQSYNVEMVEVVGGEFWKPYQLMKELPSANGEVIYDISQENKNLYHKLNPINLSGKRILNLAKGLAPAYVRVSGTWANAAYFQDNDQPAAPAPKGFVNVLTRKAWQGVIDFVKATNSKLVTSFAVSSGVRNESGVWTPVEAQKLVDYTKSIGGTIDAAELFNEPTMPAAGGEMDSGYNAASFAKDVAVYNNWAKTNLPNMLTLGPGSVLEGIPDVNLEDGPMKMLSTDALMSATPQPVFDIFSYHFYGAASVRMIQSGPFSIKAEHALTEKWLRTTDSVAAYYTALRDKYMPGKPIWISETAQASAGGDPYAATFLDCFRYVYQLGSLAQKGIKVIMHNTLAASEYSLIDQETHLPKPNYWAAFLWAKLMGTQVYDAGKGIPGVYLFAHNTRGQTEGITLLVINTNENTALLNIPADAQQFTLTAPELQGTTVLLNGKNLQLDANDELPVINGRSLKSGEVSLPGHSISFISFADEEKH